MRKLKLITLLLPLCGLCAQAHNQAADRLGYTSGEMQISSHASLKSISRAEELTPEDLLGAPEGTVYAGAFTNDAAFLGNQSSDQGRPDYTTKYFQHFSGNFYTFNQLRFFGMFSYWNEADYEWYFCDERAGINENGDATKPVRFEISFYKEAADGKPGELVYTKEVDLLGKDTGVQYGDYSSGFQDIYCFDVDLEQELKLETGYLSVSAVDMGDTPTCWFAVFTAESSVDYGLILFGDDGFQYASLPMVFYLKGSGEMAAEKALKFNRLLTPSANANSPFERVQIEVANAGSKAIDDATLQLWADNHLIWTENLGTTLAPLQSHKYTFTGRIDCSIPGVHNYEIRNVTPGDEKLCSDTYKFTIDCPEPGVTGESRSEDCDRTFITNVKFGDIDNTTEESNYSDFTGMSTTIRPGQTVAMSVTTLVPYVQTVAYIDWNGNGILGEDNERYEFSRNNNFTVDITIPEGIVIPEGDKLVRVIHSYDTPQPTGVYDMGETEDYTLTVARNDNTPALATSVEVIDSKLNNNSSKNTLTLSNSGSAPLKYNLSYTYILPNYPGTNFSTAEAAVPAEAADIKVARRKITSAARLAAPVADPATVYTVRYDNGQYDVIGIENSQASTYAHLYPGTMLAALDGMKLTSIDVYIASVPQQTSIVIYGAGSQTKCGELICEQPFTPQADSWNHIVLQNPVDINGKDLWVGVKMSGFNGQQYHIGIDYGQAVRGFGDIVNIGGDIWWSMADLGLNYNYCIRANVSGTPTPAISWMTLTGNNADIPAGGTADHEVTLNANGLDNDALYEAVIDITTNDELAPKKTLPVYLVNGAFSSIGQLPAAGDDFTVTLSGDRLTVTGAQALTLSNTAGQTVALAAGNSLSTATLNGGIYILTATLGDGTTRTAKILLRK